MHELSEYLESHWLHIHRYTIVTSGSLAMYWIALRGIRGIVLWKRRWEADRWMVNWLEGLADRTRATRSTSLLHATNIIPLIQRRWKYTVLPYWFCAVLLFCSLYLLCSLLLGCLTSAELWFWVFECSEGDSQLMAFKWNIHVVLNIS